MQTKKEAQSSKKGSTTVTSSIWSLPYLPNTSWMTPLDVVKQKIQMQETGKKPAYPAWNFTSIFNIPGLMTPLELVKVKMQTQQNVKSQLPPVFQALYNTSWNPFEIVKQQFYSQKTEKSPVTPTGNYPNVYQSPVLGTPWEVIKQHSAPWLVLPFDAVKQQIKNGAKPVTSPTMVAFQSLYGNVSSYIPSMQGVYQQAWNGANFVTVALATSFSIVAVQSPVKTMLVNLTKNGTMVPTYQGGLMGFFRAMYAGTSASISGSVIRTGYVTGAKGSTKSLEEGVHKEASEDGKKYAAANVGYVAAMALGDILVTQIPESLSTLKKVPGLLPVDFVWKTPNNAWSLMMGGFVPRYASGMVNFAALCVLEERIAKGLPIQDKNVAHFTSGMFSGMVAALFSYPFTSFKDYALVQSKVVDGRLQNANTIKLTQELFYYFISHPGESLKSFGSMACKQIPIRMGLTGVIFALVAGVGETMGQEPLDVVVPKKYQPSSPGKTKQSMFGGSSPRIEEIVEEPTKENEKDNGTKLN